MATCFASRTIFTHIATFDIGGTAVFDFRYATTATRKDHSTGRMANADNLKNSTAKLGTITDDPSANLLATSLAITGDYHGRPANPCQQCRLGFGR
jgi:hypothetical protein